MVTLVNRAKVNTPTTGAGAITLGSAVDGYQTFASAGVANGDVVRYVIEDGTGWEIGTGTYTATGSTLTRTVSESSNGGAAISLGGDATVFVGLLASDIVQVSDIGVTVQAYDANIVSDATYVHTDNNYTTAEKSKLAGVEAGATADQTAAQILTAVKTVDGAASGLDADLLDGLHASSFLQGNQTITLSGDATGSGTTSIVVTVADDSHNHIISNVDGLQTALDGKAPTVHTHTAAQITNFDAEVSNNTSVVANTAKVSNATHTGEVTGSTALTIASNVVDADNLKVTGNGTTAQYLRSDGDGSFTWATPTDTVTNQTITLSGDATGSGTTSIVVTVADDSHNHIISNVDGLQAALDGKLATDNTILKREGDISSQNWNDYWDGTEASWNTVLNATGANRPPAYAYGTALNFGKGGQAQFQLYAPETGSNGEGLRYRTSWNNGSRPWVEIWDSGNDGSGSGLDADLLDGNHASAFALASHTHDYVPERSRTDWNDSTVVNDVIGQMAWQNYGNNHTIFDASKSISPSGTSVNNTNPSVNWSATYPTLMGWNGANTYGVRVDVARYADSANTANRAYPRRVGNVDLNFNWSGQSGQPPWLWGGSDGSNMYVYNPSNFNVNYANTAGSVSPPAAGAVGSYAMLGVNTANDAVRRTAGNQLAGSALIYGASGGGRGSGVPAGTWRLMGHIWSSTDGDWNTSVWLRIS